MKYLLAAAVAVTGLMVASPANAEDRRPCVSKIEVNGVKTAPRLEVEARWEVTGDGYIDHQFSTKRAEMWVYEACGYRSDDAQVWCYFWRDNHRLLGCYRWVMPGAKHHGHL